MKWFNVAAPLLAYFVCACKSGVAPSPPVSSSHGPSSEVSKSPAPGVVVDAGTDADPDVEALFAALDSDPAEPIREVPECLDLEGAEGCTGVGAVMLACVGLGNIFLPPVTDRLTRCLHRGQGGPGLCGTPVIRDCALEAIEPSPVAPSVRKTCGMLFEQCPEPGGFRELYTEEVCLHGLSSLRDAPRRDFVRCMQARCELKLCVGHLL